MEQKNKVNNKEKIEKLQKENEYLHKLVEFLVSEVNFINAFLNYDDAKNLNINIDFDI